MTPAQDLRKLGLYHSSGELDKVGYPMTCAQRSPEYGRSLLNITCHADSYRGYIGCPSQD